MDDIRKAREKNIQWILGNRQEFAENFPNKWIAVDNSILELVDDDLFTLYKLMSGREPSAARMYYLSNLYEPALIVSRPDEVEYDSSET
ncbi:hypothetical protein CMI37_00470 [Candidatus Pacearchaeota archaeon]|nr:hypothetical protein [Candidatus Pacearchaeota archaeon]